MISSPSQQGGGRYPSYYNHFPDTPVSKYTVRGDFESTLTISYLCGTETWEQHAIINVFIHLSILDADPRSLSRYFIDDHSSSSAVATNGPVMIVGLGESNTRSEVLYNDT